MKYQDIVPFGVRLQPDLKKKLERAKPKDRSMNAEIIMRLEQSFGIRKNIGEYSDGELLDELIRRWGRDAVAVSVKIDDKKADLDKPDATDGETK